MLRNTEDTYGLIALTLHWLVALSVASLFPLGLWMVGLDYYDPWRKSAPEIHKSVGVILFATVVVRILWRLISPPPRPLRSHSPRERRAAAAKRPVPSGRAATVLDAPCCVAWHAPSMHASPEGHGSGQSVLSTAVHLEHVDQVRVTSARAD